MTTSYNQLPLQTRAGIVAGYLKKEYHKNPMAIHSALATLNPVVEFNNGICYISIRRSTMTFLSYKTRQK